MAQRVGGEEAASGWVVWADTELDEAGGVEAIPLPCCGFNQGGAGLQGKHFGAWQWAVGSESSAGPREDVVRYGGNGVAEGIVNKAGCLAFVGDPFQATCAVEPAVDAVEVGAVGFPVWGSVDDDTDFKMGDKWVVNAGGCKWIAASGGVGGCQSAS